LLLLLLLLLIAQCPMPLLLALLDGCLVLALVLSKFASTPALLLLLCAATGLTPPSGSQLPATAPTPRHRANRASCWRGAHARRNASCVARSQSTRHSSGVPLCRPVSAGVAQICRTKILSSTTT
jgi:hypothetical protein